MLAALHLMLVAHVCMHPSLAVRPQEQHAQPAGDNSPTLIAVDGSHPQVELLKPKSASAIDNSSALLGMSQNASGFVLKESLHEILVKVLRELVIPESPECPTGNAHETNDDCVFRGTITVRHQGGVQVGCMEHLAMGDKNVLHATGLATDLAVDLSGFVIKGITLDGVAKGHVEMPEIYLALYKGNTDLDAASSDSWSLSINEFQNRGGIGHGGIVGGALQYSLKTWPQIRAKLGKFVLDLLKPVIVNAIKENVEGWTKNYGTRGALGGLNFVNKMTNFVTTGHFKSQPGCSV